jgi:hypothetical protein
MAKCKLASLCFIAAALAGSCGVMQDGPVVQLWSQTPDILPFVDRFNAIQNKYKVEVTYVQSPAEELLPSQTVPDLILSDRLSAPRCAAKLENLTPLLRGDGVDTRLFYQDLLAAHQYQNAPVVLPFSFELPVIVFRKGAFAGGTPRLVSLDELKSISQGYNKLAKTGPIALGFSPLWNRRFLFHAATLFGVDFRAEPGKTLAWDDQALENWVQTLTDWIEGRNGGFAAETEFVRKYLYEAPYHLIQTKIPLDKKQNDYRISFYQALAADFIGIPAEKREALDMAWLSRDRKIPVDDDILFFGVPRGAGNQGGAYEFLKWVFRPATQKGILEENETKNPLSFGVAGGFSSLISINETEIPARVPLLKGRMPSANELKFPGVLPEAWEKLKNEAILPWLYDRIAHTPGAAPLKERIK